MTQLAPSHGGPPRISQLLPTVKCSTCSAPVPLDQLGDHVCAPVPPMPTRQASTPPKSPSRSTALALNLKGIISPSRTKSPGAVSSSSRSRAPSTSSVSSRDTRSSYSTIRSSTRQSSQPSLPEPPNFSVPSHQPPVPPLSLSPHITDGPLTTRSPSPISTGRSSSSRTPSSRPPSSNSTRSRKLSSASALSANRPPERNPSPGAPPSNGQPSIRSPSSIRTGPFRRPSHSISPPAPPPTNQLPLPPPHMPSSPNPPSSPKPPSTRLPAFPGPYVHSHSPGDPLTPSTQLSSLHSPSYTFPPRSPALHSPATPSTPSTSFSSLHSPQYHPHSPSLSIYSHIGPVEDIDTKIGGEAGMAGVGRRGFAAAARAAMLAQSMHGSLHSPAPSSLSISSSRVGTPWQHEHEQQEQLAAPTGMDGRRANAPKWLDISRSRPDAFVNNIPILSNSPNSLSPSSPTPNPGSQPHSPHSPHSISRSPSPLRNGVSSPNGSGTATPTKAEHQIPSSLLPARDSTSTVTGSPSRRPLPLALQTRLSSSSSSLSNSPSSIPFPSKPPSPFIHSSEPYTPTTPTTPRLPFFEKYRNKFADNGVKVNGGDDDDEAVEDDVNPAVIEPLMSPTAEDSEMGLAYASSEASDHEETGRRRPSRSSSTYSQSLREKEGAGADTDLGNAMEAFLRSPTGSSVDLEADEPIVPIIPPTPTRTGFGGGSPSLRPVKLPTRSHTSPSQRDSARVVASGAGLSPGFGMARRGGTISGAIGGGHGRGDDDDDGTSVGDVDGESVGGTLTTATKKKKKKLKVRDCVRCGKRIEDGRWIRVESGKGVLCDRCWKNMYLPKCRRCNLPIEKQAVSSSDGQLKGKYHRDCFNCHTCQKPFPDKEFYVHDGKPYCGYHYHEANGSLCAAPDCGEPIEGPCAVSHTGEKYHPEHLTCEWVDDEDDEDDFHFDSSSEYGSDDGGGGRLPLTGRTSGRKDKDKDKRRCTEKLVEYWEVEGKMLCESHMKRIVDEDRVGMSEFGGEDEQMIHRGAMHGDGDEMEFRMLARDEERSSRALKRVTRFIDLQGLGSNGLR